MPSTAVGAGSASTRPAWTIKAWCAVGQDTLWAQHQVRRWRSWHRWTTLAMLAHAFLAVATATERDTQPHQLD